MDLQAIRQLVEAAGLGDLPACRRELADIACARAVLARREMDVMRRLRHLGADGEGEHARATKSSSKSSYKARRRSDAGEQIPQLDDALAAGETSAEHVDVVADALAGLSPQDRGRLAAHGDDIRAKAGELAEGEFRRWFALLVRRVRQDDAATRLARQKAANRASWWQDNEGMWNLRGRFDPETGLRLQGRIGAATDAMRKGAMPEGAPIDLLDRQQWLQAMALAQLIDGAGADSSGSAAGSGSAVADVVIVIDAKTLLEGEHEHTILDTLGFDLPLDTIRRWACTANITPVIVGLDGTRLMLGRTTRLANADQRRALRVLHPTCPCCETPFDRCQVHHVQWWDDDGPTDITNLLPVCPRLHHLAHEGGWTLRLNRDRSLTMIEPDGTRHDLAPPRVRAA